MLWHNEQKFCIWLYFTELQIKFECRQLVLIFVGVMPLLELRTLEILSFPHFSLTCFDIMSWKFCIWLCFTVLASSFAGFTVLASIFVGVMPLLELRILEIHSFPHFSLTRSSYMHLQIKLKFRIFNAFLLEKYYTKKPFKMFMTGVLCTVCGAQVYFMLSRCYLDGPFVIGLSQISFPFTLSIEPS